MFPLTPERLQRLLSLLDDVLGDPPAEAPTPHIHPHRRPLVWQPMRRAGQIGARPAHCISPIRLSTRQQMRDGATR